MKVITNEKQITDTGHEVKNARVPVLEGATAPNYVDRAEPATEDYRQVDVLSQLKANLIHIEDLSFRLNFMLGEVKGLIKK